MQAWSFIVAAYAVTFVGTGGVAFAAWRAMRRAEAQAEGLSKRA